jgi:ribonuclease E
VHEEYAVQRWPETKRLLGLLVNSAGGAHARNARRLIHAARKQDRRLSAALLAAALAHTPEAEEALRGARTRMARKPPALARELLRNFPKRRARNARRRRKGSKGAGASSNGARAGAGNSNRLDDTRGETNGADGANSSGASENLNGARGTAGAGAGRPPRAPKSRRRKAKSQTPSDAVLTEALSSAPAGARDNGGELAPGAGEKLQRNVEEALDHAEE